MRAWKLALALLLLSGGQLLCTRAPHGERTNDEELNPPPPRREEPRPPAAPEPDASSSPETSPPKPLRLEERAPWATRLERQLAKAGYLHSGVLENEVAFPVEAVGASQAPEVGVYVRHLGTGAAFSLRADEPWYLASGVKVPVALAVLHKTETGELRLDSRLRLEAEDRVDGTGSTHTHPTNALLRLDYLLEQMLVYSDNTATDLLIRHVGLDEVNLWARRLSGADFRITTLAEVRRKTYRAFHEKAAELAFEDWVALRRRKPHATGHAGRVALLTRLIGVSPEELAVSSVDAAFDAFYAEGYNSAPLRAYGELLARIARGQALGDAATAYLLETMTRVQTGKSRLRAGLPRGIAFAHKTGTQHRRVCDLGMALPGSAATSPPAPVLIAACTRGFASVTAAERALRDVGTAVSASGVLDPIPLPPKPPSPRRLRERREALEADSTLAARRDHRDPALDDSAELAPHGSLDREEAP